MSQGVDDGNDGSAVKQAVKPSYADVRISLSYAPLPTALRVSVLVSNSPDCCHIHRSH